MRRLTLLLALLALASCKKKASAEALPPTPPSGLAFVTAEDGGEVVELEIPSGRVLSRASIGKRPRGIRLSRDGKLLFVALSGTPKAGPHAASVSSKPDPSADGIGVFDLAQNKLLRIVRSGSDPESFDLSRDGQTLFVANEDAAKASIVDLGSGAVRASIDVGGEPEGVATRPDGGVVYVTSEADAKVTVLDTAKHGVIAAIPVGKRPRGIAFTPDSSLAFVTNELSATVSVVDAQKHVVVATVPLREDARPMGAKVTADGKTAWISTGRGRAIVAIDVATKSVRSTVHELCERPWGIDTTADGRFVVVACGPSGYVAIVDSKDDSIRSMPIVGGSPWGVAVH